MAKLIFRTGKRGRPMELDTERVLDAFYNYLPRAKQSLAEFRAQSAGFSNPELLGTKTSLPEWLETSIDALERFAADKITAEMAREIKKDLAITKKLASKIERVSTTALEETITEQYYKSLDAAAKYQSKFAQTKYMDIKKQIYEMTPKQRIQFYKSKGYQDVGSFRDLRYKRIKSWAEESTGQKLTYKESYAYLIARRMEDGMDTASEIRSVANVVTISNDLPFDENEQLEF